MYELIETEGFQKNFKNSGIVKKDYESFKDAIQKSPKTAKGSHSLKGILRGVRSAHIRGGKFIILFLICEECCIYEYHIQLKKFCEKHGVQKNCDDSKTLIMLSCGNHGYYKTFERQAKLT